MGIWGARRLAGQVKGKKPSTHHRNPDMDPPTRQKLKHNSSLWREHTRVLLLILLLALFGCQTRAIVDRLSGWRAGGWGNNALRVGWRPELVWLFEDTALPCLRLGFVHTRNRAGCGKAGVQGAVLVLEGAEGPGCWEASGEEEMGDWSWHFGAAQLMSCA